MLEKLRRGKLEEILMASITGLDISSRHFSGASWPVERENSRQTKLHAKLERSLEEEKENATREDEGNHDDLE